MIHQFICQDKFTAGSYGDLSGTSIQDPATPASSAGYYYLVRGTNGCGDGTYGEGAGGTPRWSQGPLGFATTARNPWR